MTSRTCVSIAAMLFCQLVLLTVGATCQTTPSSDATSEPALENVQPGQEVTIRAQEQEKDKEIYTLRGDVEITFRDYTLRADEVTYNAETGAAKAKGDVIFEGGPHQAHIEAKSADYNIKTGDGKFFEVVGSIGARVRASSIILTSVNPFLFTGKEVDKIGRNRYVVLHGKVTTCQLPRPDWTFNAEKVEVEAGEDARIYHSTFRVLGIPVFYFPFASHPVETLGRTSGFLIPTIGKSSSKGFIIGDSAYWAINRSMDTTIGAEYFSKRGWSQHMDFRARPSENSYINMRYFGVLDRGDPSTHIDQGGENASLDAELNMKNDMRAVANVNFLSSFLFKLAFSESFTQAVDSEVKSVAFLSKAMNGFSFDLMGSRYQNFQSTTRGDQILMIHMPSIEVSTPERRLLDTRVVWSFDGNAEGVSRREPDFVTGRLVGRYDVSPHLALPLVWNDWGLRTEIGVRNTYYTEQQLPTATDVGSIVNQGLNRQSVEGLVELRPPAISRIFEQPIMGRTFKHVIEPRIAYNYVTGVDNFRNVIRFDARDIQSDTSEVEIGVVQRLYAKESAAHRDSTCDLLPANTTDKEYVPGEFLPGSTAEPLNCESEGTSSREILSWELKQKYFANDSFGGAIINGRRNVLSTTADFTGIAFLTKPRQWSPIVSRLRVQPTRNTDVDWQLDYDFKQGQINASTTFVNYRIHEFFVGGSQAMLRVPGEVVTSSASTTTAAPDIFNQFRVIAGYGYPGKRGISAGTSVGFDVETKDFQYSAVQTSYNWDCCGVSLEYRRFSLGSIRNESQFRFAFTLSNVGAFGNLRRQERLY